MILFMFTVMLSTCVATDKADFNDEEKNDEIVPKWPKFNKISNNQVRPYDNVGEKNENNFSIFVENTELSPSPSNKVQLYTGPGRELNQTENQLATISPSNSFSTVVVERDLNGGNGMSKGKCPACVYISRARMENVWRNLSERKRTKIVASVCCPCIFLRFWPDFLAFIFWLIFYFESNRVCVSDTKSVSVICENNQIARDITAGLAIFFFLIRVLKFCKKKYKIRPRVERDPSTIPNYGFNFKF